jgi:hypothetical protein
MCMKQRHLASASRVTPPGVSNDPVQSSWPNMVPKSLVLSTLSRRSIQAVRSASNRRTIPARLRARRSRACTLLRGGYPSYFVALASLPDCPRFPGPRLSGDPANRSRQIKPYSRWRGSTACPGPRLRLQRRPEAKHMKGRSCPNRVLSVRLAQLSNLETCS